ncbi:MAG TPA: DUF881 domain-containing protein [Actinomycetota bacterium]|nr:DUF881 domain-containing protein [Actinomycetota bacterium]
MDWGEPPLRTRELRGPTMRPPSRLQTRVALVVVAAAVGFLVGVQARNSEEVSSRLAAESPEDLTRILADLNTEADRLAREVSRLQVRLVRYRTSAEQDDLLLEDARKSLADLQVLSGTVPVRGSGVVVLIADTDGRVTWELLLDLVQELRDAGAEAIAIGDHRVVASTWFGPAPSGVVVDGEPLAPPYEVKAIGPSEAMAEALGIPGGPVAVITAQPNVTLDVVRAGRLVLPALQREVAFRYARPAS